MPMLMMFVSGVSTEVEVRGITWRLRGWMLRRGGYHEINLP